MLVPLTRNSRRYSAKMIMLDRRFRLKSPVEPDISRGMNEPAFLSLSLLIRREEHEKRRVGVASCPDISTSRRSFIGATSHRIHTVARTMTALRIYARQKET